MPIGNHDKREFIVYLNNTIKGPITEKTKEPKLHRNGMREIVDIDINGFQLSGRDRWCQSVSKVRSGWKWGAWRVSLFKGLKSFLDFLRKELIVFWLRYRDTMLTRHTEGINIRTRRKRWLEKEVF